MRLIKFIIQNYKSLSGDHKFEPQGSSFMLLAANGKGKTSAGAALIDLLTNNVPSKPITEGKNEGFMEFTFDNGQKIVGKLTPGAKPKIEFLSPEGLGIKTPKEVIQKLIGTGMDFNIDNFLSMAPKPRRELLEKIAGIDLSRFNLEEKELEEERRIKNAEAKAAEARVKPYDEKLAEKDVTDTAEAVVKLQEMIKVNDAVQKVKDGLVKREQRITEITEQIRLLQDEIETKKSEIAKGNEWLIENPGFTPEEVESQETIISQVDQIKEAKRLKEESQNRDKLLAEAKKIDDMIKELRNRKDAAIKAAKLPAEGLEFDTETDNLLLDGLPFESNQIAQSRKLIAAVQIAASMLGEIKYLHFDGAALDKSSADNILKWAEKNGLQLCLERPIWEGGDEVKMEIISSDEEQSSSLSTDGLKTLNDLPASVQKKIKDNQDAVREDKKPEEEIKVVPKKESKFPWEE